MDTSAVVVAAGARDRYQVPIALHEAQALDSLVTDLYIPLDKPVVEALASLLGANDRLKRRYADSLPSERVSVPRSMLKTEAWSWLPFFRVHAADKDRELGEYACRIAARRQAALFSYSYYAYSAFSNHCDDLPFRFIFQVHPHPIEVRQTLAEEIERTPFASASLRREPDLALSEPFFEQLAREPHLANGWVVASSFSAKTLGAQGIPQDRIHIVPYGVDSTAFPQRPMEWPSAKCFTIIFLGSTIQRKGLSYLLDAVRLAGTSQVCIILAGRGFCDENLLAQYRDLQVEIHRDLSHEELVRQIYRADVMVLPSLVEGFAHVILEAMSCGVPVITTPHTCGPDILRDGKDGFVVPIRDANEIAAKLTWGIQNRAELRHMGGAAAARARQFTWERFREGIREAYRHMLRDAEVSGGNKIAHVG